MSSLICILRWPSKKRQSVDFQKCPKNLPTNTARKITQFVVKNMDAVKNPFLAVDIAFRVSIAKTRAGPGMKNPRNIRYEIV